MYPYPMSPTFSADFGCGFIDYSLYVFFSLSPGRLLGGPHDFLRLEPARPVSQFNSRTDPQIDAFYFDYKRRNDPEFRKALKRDKKRHAKSQKAQAEAANAEQRRLLVAAVRDAQIEGFPTDVEEKEAYFMNEVAQGEGLCQEGSCWCEFGGGLGEVDDRPDARITGY